MILLPEHLFRRQQGFSLLEILVAFVILAMSLGVLFQIYSRGARTAALTEDYTQAVTIAQSQLALLRGKDTLEPGESSGTTEDGMNWEVRISDYIDPDDSDAFRKLYKLLQVEVDVRWKTLGHERDFSLQTLRLSINR